MKNIAPVVTLIQIVLGTAQPSFADNFETMCSDFRKKAGSERIQEFNAILKEKFDKPTATVGIIYDTFPPKESLSVEKLKGWLGTPNYVGEFIETPSVIYYLGEAEGSKLHAIIEIRNDSVRHVMLAPIKAHIEDLMAEKMKYEKELAAKEKFLKTTLQELANQLFGVSLRRNAQAIHKKAKDRKIQCFDVPQGSEAGLGTLQFSAALDNTSSATEVHANYFDNTTYKISAFTRDGLFLDHILTILKDHEITEVPSDDKSIKKYQISPRTTLEIASSGNDGQGFISIYDGPSLQAAEAAYEKYRHPKAK